MTSLSTLPTISFLSGGMAGIFQSKLKTFEDGNEGQTIEHDAEAPSPVQLVIGGTKYLAILAKVCSEALFYYLRRNLVY